MKATQILYLVLIAGIIYWIVTSTHLLDFESEGFENVKPFPKSEPAIPKVLSPTSIKMEAMPNPSTLDALPFGPYAQMASTGSYQFKDPAMLPAGLSQLKKLDADIRSFLVFEGVSLADTSDPSIQLPLTQLRADSQKLQSEITVLDKNPGVDSQLTQQDLGDMEGSLSFLQRKVRLFETAGLVTEGFVGGPGARPGGGTLGGVAAGAGAANRVGAGATAPAVTVVGGPTGVGGPAGVAGAAGPAGPAGMLGGSRPGPGPTVAAGAGPVGPSGMAGAGAVGMAGAAGMVGAGLKLGGLGATAATATPEATANSGKTRATFADLVAFQKRIYSAILTLSASGTTDPVVQARIKALQDMYTDVTDMIIKLNKGTMKPDEIPLYKNDINAILPKLANPSQSINKVFNQPSGKKLSPIEQELSTLVGEEHATSVFNNLKDKGMFRVTVDLGYNVHGSNGSVLSQTAQLQPNGKMIPVGAAQQPGAAQQQAKPQPGYPRQQGPVAPMGVDLPFDNSVSGMDDRAASKSGNKPSKFDWKKRATSICEQVKLRGLEPLDFGCIAKDSLMSPAYSWRGHSKMICGRLAATMDPGLPVTCGCPPSNWKGWTL
jgi:hypothetical protein